MVPVKMRELALGNPFIHDVTTDFDKPPAIVAAADLPRNNPPHYVGGENVPRSDPPVTVADAQRSAFPDIQPLIVSSDLETTAASARAAIKSMGMETLAEGPASDEAGSGWRIEAVSTSFWYGFKDDFVVRLVAPQQAELPLALGDGHIGRLFGREQQRDVLGLARLAAVIGLVHHPVVRGEDLDVLEEGSPISGHTRREFG